MRVNKYWILPVLCFMLLANASLSGLEPDKWRMEIRIAADATEDIAIVELAKRSNEQDVYRNGQLVGKWIRVLKNAEAVLDKEDNLVTRRNEQDQLELLVLVNPDDVNESDVCRVSPSKDREGRLALLLEFNDEGSSKLFNLTKKYAYQKSERYGALIMDGKVYSAPAIANPVSQCAQVTGDFDHALIENIRQRTKKGFVEDVYDEPPPYAITITPLRLIVFFCVLFIIILGCLPARNLKKSKHPHFWTISGSIVGMLVGAYALGVTKTAGTESTILETCHYAVLTTIVVNLTRVLIGSVVGIGCGFFLGRLCRFFVRRAVYNIATAIIRIVK